MPEPIHIPVSDHQRARLAAFQQDAQLIQQRFNDAVTMAVAARVDPLTLQGWDIRLEGAEIVCTPPAEQAPA